MDESPAQANSVEPQSGNTGGGGFSWYAWLLAGVLVVYPLSLGPAAKLHQACPAARPTIEVLYEPVVLLIKHCPAAEKFFVWYLSTVWKLN